MSYKARRSMLINGQAFKPGQVVPEAEKLQKFRTLVSAGWLIKAKEVAPTPPASPPADVNSGTRKELISPSPNRTKLDKEQYESWVARQEAKQKAKQASVKQSPKAKPVTKPKTKQSAKK